MGFGIGLLGSGIRGGFVATLAPVAWWLADPAYVTLVSGGVDVWLDRSGNGNHMTAPSAGTRPIWDPGGLYAPGIPSLAPTATQYLQATSGTLISAFTGNDKPFSVLCNMRWTGVQPATLDQVLLSWDDSGGGALSESICRTQNSTGGTMCYQRVDASGAGAQFDGSTVISQINHQRFGWLYNGTDIRTRLENAADPALASPASAVNVGSLTINRARLFKSGSIAGCIAYVTEVVVLSRLITDDEWSAYRLDALARFGV